MSDLLTGQRFEVPVNLDKPRMLRIDFNALCKAEEVSGLSFLDFTATWTATRLKAITWASIVYEPEERRFTYEEIGDLLNAKFLDVQAAIAEAWLAGMPDPEEGEQDPLQADAAPS